VVFAAGGRVIASAGGDAALKLWDAATGRPLGSLLGHAEKIWSISVSPDGSTLATASSDGTVKLWDAQPPSYERTLWRFSGNIVWPDADFTSDGQTVVIPEAIGRDAVHAEGKTSYLVDARLEVTEVDLKTGKMKAHRLIDKRQRAGPAFLMARGKLVGWYTSHPSVTLWDLTGGHRLTEIGSVNCIPMWSELLIISNELGRWDVISAVNGKTLYSLEVPIGSYYLACSPNSDMLATRAGDQLVLWDLKSSRIASQRRVDGPGYSAASFSPDGTILALGDQAGEIQLCESPTLKPITTLVGHSKVNLFLTFSPDGKTLLSSNDDGTWRLWDVTGGDELLTLCGSPPGNSRAPWTRFSPDGRSLIYREAAAGNDELRVMSTQLPEDLASEEDS
jgi:WD40 repeat protein